jgi:hypothetical protein
MGHEHVHRKLDRVRRESGETFGSPFRIADVEDHALAFHPAMLAQPLPEDCDEDRVCGASGR